MFDMDKASSFTCLFDRVISSDFISVVILILLDTYAMQPISTHVNFDDIKL